MDLDIEMGDDAQALPLEMEEPTKFKADDILQPDEPEEAGEVIEDTEEQTDDSKTLIPTKIHIRGLDAMNTDDIKNYVKAHYGPVDRVEWIDDTAANLLFASEFAARDALIALSTIEIADPTALAIGEETLPAKSVEGRPETSLHIRYTVLGDRKTPGAALRSRFYLLNPEYDPEERRRSKYRERNGSRRGRRESESETGISFEASMYDDVPRASREKYRRSSSPDRLRNRGKELFTGSNSRKGRGTRDRSASPARSDESMSEEASSSSNRVKARSIKSRISSDNRSKELFPSKKTLFSGGGGQLDALGSAMGSAHLREEDRPRVVESSGNFSIRGSAARGGQGDGFAIKGASAKELFPGRFGGGGGGGGRGGAGANAGKELLDAKRRTRQRAEDLFG